MIILQTMRHSPESCPLGNSKNLDIKVQWLEDLEKIVAKYGIKVVGVWTDRLGHTSYAVFDAPNMEVFINFEFDPQNVPMVTFNDIKRKVVTPAKETLAFLKERKLTKQ